MPAASILIKPASSLCNIDCKYCFYKKLCSKREEYSKGIMKDDVLEQLVKNAVDYADDLISFAFQGGEPMIAGIGFYEKVVALQKKYNTKNLFVENTIQTNATLIDDKWAKFLGDNNFLVGISCDGPKKIHDNYRRDISGNGTFDKIMHAIELFEKYNVKYNIATVITEDAASKASYLYKFYKRNHFKFVQLIPCMSEKLDYNQSDMSCMEKYAVRPQSYGKFLVEMFNMWFEDFINGETMEIRTFSNLAQIAAGFMAEECGMNGCCSCYFVTEGDGSVYPCDFYCTDEWKLGTVYDSFKDMSESDKAKRFVEESRNISPKCPECKYYKLCKGGCRHWRCGTENENYLCSGYKYFYENCSDKIMLLGQMIRKKMKNTY